MAIDYWRVTVTGNSGEVADVEVKLNGDPVFDESPVSLPHNTVVVNNPTGTVEAHAARTDGSSGALSVVIVANGAELASDSDSGPNAVVDVSATR